MKKILISTLTLILSLISCASSSQSQTQTQIVHETVAFVENSSEEISIVGAWTGSMILGSKDKKGNWAYHGFENYHFYNDNRLKYSMKVENYGIVTSDYSHTYEWKYENGKYYKRLYKHNSSVWAALNLVYVDENNIVIDDIKLKRVSL